jgi:pilus assembly protein Flp/PilA
MLTQYVRTVLALKADKRAVTAIEYALIAALIAVFIIGALSTLGTSISSTFQNVANKL